MLCIKSLFCYTSTRQKLQKEVLMPSSKKTAVHSHIDEHRGKLYRSALIAYAVSRCATIFFGLALAVGYFLTPFSEGPLVPDFALIVFIVILGTLWFSEMVFRLAKYSSDVYVCETCTEEGAGSDKKFIKKQNVKSPLLVRFALNFPFRGIHVFLLGLWFVIAFFYYILYAKAAYAGGVIIFSPENYILSLYIISAACALDLIAKAAFIIKIPELGQFVKDIAELAGAVINQDSWVKNIGRSVFDPILRKWGHVKEK